MIRQFGWGEFRFLLEGARWTVVLSFLAFTVGGALGLAVALGRTSKWKMLRILMATYIQIFQGTPLLIQLFFVYFGLPLLGFKVDVWVALTISTVMALRFAWERPDAMFFATVSVILMMIAILGFVISLGGCDLCVARYLGKTL